MANRVKRLREENGDGSHVLDNFRASKRYQSLQLATEVDAALGGLGTPLEHPPSPPAPTPSASSALRGTAVGTAAASDTVTVDGHYRKGVSRASADAMRGRRVVAARAWRQQHRAAHGTASLPFSQRHRSDGATDTIMKTLPVPPGSLALTHATTASAVTQSDSEGGVGLKSSAHVIDASSVDTAPIGDSAPPALNPNPNHDQNNGPAASCDSQSTSQLTDGVDVGVQLKTQWTQPRATDDDDDDDDDDDEPDRSARPPATVPSARVSSITDSPFRAATFDV